VTRGPGNEELSVVTEVRAEFLIIAGNICRTGKYFMIVLITRYAKASLHF
jgi:hypothetical protein